MSDAQENPNRPRGRRIALDPLAKSASRTEPAIVAKPEGAPMYHGFQILSDVVVEYSILGGVFLTLLAIVLRFARIYWPVPYLTYAGAYLMQVFFQRFLEWIPWKYADYS